MLYPNDDEPAGQSVQETALTKFLYLPAAHATHDPEADANPVLQAQSFTVELANTVDNNPSGQGVHAVDSPAALYVPVVHAVQEPRLEPV